MRLRVHPKTKHIIGKPDFRQYQLLVNWRGYDEDTWEPLENLFEDVPDLVDDFFERKYGIVFSQCEEIKKKRVKGDVFWSALQSLISTKGVAKLPPS